MGSVAGGSVGCLCFVETRFRQKRVFSRAHWPGELKHCSDFSNQPKQVGVKWRYDADRRALATSQYHFPSSKMGTISIHEARTFCEAGNTKLIRCKGRQ